MLARIRNKYLRRFLVIVSVPPAFLIVVLLGAFAGPLFMVQEVAGAVRGAWKGER